MKRILFALALVAFVMPAIPRVNGADTSVDFFYNNLSGGNWVEAGDYGYGWQPDVAASNADWRPYADGYWAYTDYGWTWVSYEDFGWATYHYGRWARLADYGWVWFPGSDLTWGPAWVSWRYGSNYCGWAPLPPRGPGVVYEGRPIGGHVDVEFDIGPAYYNFVDIRYIGAPVLRSYIYPPTQNVTYVTQTVNVTNITVKNKTVYNYGPDYAVLSQHSERPIQRLKVERQSNVNLAEAVKSGNLTKVQGDKLVVAAPERIQKPAKQVAPPSVKTKISKDKVKLEKGWSVAGDENSQKQLKQKIKSQDLKKIPPPIEGKGTKAAAGGSAAATPSPAAGAHEGKGKGKAEKHGDQGQAIAEKQLPPGTADATEKEKGKHGQGRDRGQATENVTGTGQPSPQQTEHGKPKGKAEKGKVAKPSNLPGEAGANATGHGKQKSKPEKNARPLETIKSDENAHGQAKQNGKANKPEKREMKSVESTGPAAKVKTQHKGPSEQGMRGQAGGDHGKEQKAHKAENMAPTNRGASNAGAKQPKQKPEQTHMPQQEGGGPAEGKHGQAKAEGQKKKKGEKESPSPQ